MFSSKVKVLVLISALLVFIGVFSVGCKEHPKATWVNTNSMPGRTFKGNSESTNPNIVYLGSSKSSSGVAFGPRNVSFEFKDLR